MVMMCICTKHATSKMKQNLFYGILMTFLIVISRYCTAPMHNHDRLKKYFFIMAFPTRLLAGHAFMREKKSKMFWPIFVFFLIQKTWYPTDALRNLAKEDWQNSLNS